MMTKTTSLIRFFLAITFLFYGLVKVAGGQFKYDDFVLDSQTTDGPTMVWCFYGYSPVYGRLIGLAEMLPALLLLIPRTRTLGALLLLPIAANIAVMDFCFRFPEVKYFALLLTALDLCLLAADWRKLTLLLRLAIVDEARLKNIYAAFRITDTEPHPAEKELQSTPARSSIRIKHGLLAIVGLLIALFLANALMAALTDPVEAATEYCIRRGWDRRDLLLRRWVMSSGWSGLGRKGVVQFEVRDTDPPQVIQLTVEQPHAFAEWQIQEKKVP